MEHKIVKVDAGNYSRFDDMVYWRMNGSERLPAKEATQPDILKELANPDLFIYAVEVDNRFVGWISLIYMPKVGRFSGHGHIYVDELWVEPSFQRNGFAFELMKWADVLKEEKCAAGRRLYVNLDNPGAKKLYEKCGFVDTGSACFMEK